MGKVALVTGGTKGIGAAIAIALKKAGYLVAANYHRDAKAAEAFYTSTQIPVFSWNVSDCEACAVGVGKVSTALGGGIDILINNAGITKDMMLHKMDPDSWSGVIATNLDSVFNMSRVVIQEMRNKKFGRIVNISSINGLKGQIGQANYSAAKAGMLGFTKSLALESANKGITVNAVAPGYVETDMTSIMREDMREKIVATIQVGRFGRVDEIAHAVLFLVDDMSSFITGITLSVNGGQYL
jgi:acetoacetyl-CoA reductase